MAWVFLAGKFAYKLKKPACNEYLDFSTVEKRHRDCELELSLNRRLAESVYLAVVPLGCTCDGTLRIGSTDLVVDWLVQMRRLPHRLMLDVLIASSRVANYAIESLCRKLCRYYRAAPPCRIDPLDYCHRLQGFIEDSLRTLHRSHYDLPQGLIAQSAESLLAFVDRHAGTLEGRTRQGRIVDGHGDLRPEHVCLEPLPVVIDCLEFNADLRMLDAADDLSFLTLECDMLGANTVSRLIWQHYCDFCADRVPPELLDFYQRRHAFTRAAVAIRHLDDPVINNHLQWRAKAIRYLTISADVA